MIVYIASAHGITLDPIDQVITLPSTTYAPSSTIMVFVVAPEVD